MGDVDVLVLYAYCAVHRQIKIQRDFHIFIFSCK